jgi:hypothetical protein
LFEHFFLIMFFHELFYHRTIINFQVLNHFFRFLIILFFLILYFLILPLMLSHIINHTIRLDLKTRPIILTILIFLFTPWVNITLRLIQPIFPRLDIIMRSFIYTIVYIKVSVRIKWMLDRCWLLSLLLQL